MAPSRDKVKMEAGATLSASQMTGGNKGTSGVKLENVKQEGISWLPLTFSHAP